MREYRTEPWQPRICKHCGKEKIIERFPLRTLRGGKRARRHVCDLCIAKQSAKSYQRRKQEGRLRCSNKGEQTRSARRHAKRMADPVLHAQYNADRRKRRLEKQLQKAGAT